MNFQDESAMEPSDSFSENVKRFDLEFTGILIGLLQRINDRAFANSTDKFISLANRINYNSFYNHQIELLCVKDSMGVTSGSGFHAGGDRNSTNRNGK